MITSPQGYYEQGYKDGQQLYSQSQTYQQSDLRRIVSQNIARATATQDTAIPMTMQAHYEDGLLAGYKDAGKLAEKRQT